MHYSDYDITEPPPPYWWIGVIPPIKKIWDTPVAQQIYKPVPRKFIPPPLLSLIAGITISILLNVVFQSDVFQDSSVMAGLMTSIVIPIAFTTGFASFRIIIICLLLNVVQIRRRVDNTTLNSMLAVPVSDSRFFHSLNFPALLAGLRFVENTWALALGVILPFMIIQKVWPGAIFESSEILSPEPAGWALWVIFLPLLLTLLLSNASTLYALKFQASYATAIAILHILACAGFTWFVRLTWFTIFPPHGISDIPKLLAGEAICIAIMFGLAGLTGRIGVMMFARFRRPGFNETEWASAAGLIQGD